MVIEDLKHILAPQKMFGDLRQFCHYGGTENLGVTRHTLVIHPKPRNPMGESPQTLTFNLV